MQLSIYLCSFSSTCFGLIRPSSGAMDVGHLETLGSFTLNFGLKYEIIYQLDTIEYLFVFFQFDMFRDYTPIFRSNITQHYTTRPPNLLNTHTHSTHTHILHTPYMGYTLSIPTKDP